MTTSREVRLKSRPSGLPTNDHFEFVSVKIPNPAAGEVQVRNTWMTVDPYMIGRMYDGSTYAAPYGLGEVMHGGAIGEVAISNDPAFKPGDKVRSAFGWREAFNAPASQVQKLETMGMPEQLFLSALGTPGLTAYAGLMRIASFKAGDVVFVSGGAGAVGSMVVQIAKLKGGTVIATAGGPDKVAFLREIGVDHAIDYKATPDLAKAVAEATPGGFDIYFDNVGGDHLEAAIEAAKPHARFAICGGISSYEAMSRTGPGNFMLTVGKRLRIEGFVVHDHRDLKDDYARDMRDWIRSGKVQVRETVEHGIDNAVTAFLKLFNGGNTGKMLVKL